MEAQVTFRLGSITAAPGESTLSLPFSIAVDPGASPVSGWTAAIAYEPTVLGAVTIESAREADFFAFLDQGKFVKPGTVAAAAAYHYDPNGSKYIFPSSDPVAARLKFCVLESAPAGRYPIDFVPIAVPLPVHGAGQPVSLAYASGSVSHYPLVEGGSIAVAGSPASGGGCPPDEHPSALLQGTVLLKLGEAAAAPGEMEVSLPISIFVEPGDSPVTAWYGVVSYDPSVIGQVAFESASGACCSWITPQESFIEPGRVGVRFHYETGGDTGAYITAENSGVVANMKFCILETAPLGIHPVEFLPRADMRPPSKVAIEFPFFPTLYRSGGSARMAIREAGAIAIQGEPVSGEGCPPDVRPPDDPPDPPSTTGIVVFKLGEAAAAPGEQDVSLPFSIVVGPGETAATGWSAAVRYDPDVLGQVSIGPGREVEFLQFYPESEFVEAGIVGAQAIFDFGANPGRFLSPENDGVVAWLHFCVLESAPPGYHPLEFVPRAYRLNRFSISTLFAAGGQNFVPLVQDPGAIFISGSPAGGTCQRDLQKPLPPEPKDLRASFKLEDGSGWPGGTVVIPFSINSNGDAGGFAFSVDFDEEVLEAIDIEKVFLLPDQTTNYSFASFYFDNANNSPGNGGVDEGFFVGALVFGIPDRISLPRDTDSQVLAFHFRIREDAPVGTTAVRFVNGARGRGEAVTNAITVSGHSLFPSLDDYSYIFVNGRIEIIDIATFNHFIRGDSNSDLAVDQSDAVYTLEYLFLGGPPPGCLDGADANDDGDVDVSDPIRTLEVLFLGRGEIPPPKGGAGEDPTPDVLGCRSRMNPGG
ncbi:MAG: hypothetical protein HY717_08535 [Planctomycetes bacterium]|nr:hypothetical protein [Planctomycetota bacterium]